MMAYGGGGGGFMPQQSDSTGYSQYDNYGQQPQPQQQQQSFSHAGSTGAMGKQRAPTTFRPLTIKQILDAPMTDSDASIIIDGQLVTEATLVICVKSVKPIQSSAVVYTIEDGTGSMDAKQWNNNNNTANQSNAMNNPMMQGMEVPSTYDYGTWLRIYATIRLFNKEKSLNIVSARMVTDFNEVTYHNLAVIHTHLMLTRGPISSSSSNNNNTNNASAVNPYAMPSSNSASRSIGMGNPNDYNSSSNNMLAASMNPIQDAGLAHIVASFSPVQRDVFAIYRANQSQYGADVNDVVKALRGRYDPKEISKVVENFIEEGYIYITCDSYHAKVTM